MRFSPASMRLTSLVNSVAPPTGLMASRMSSSGCAARFSMIITIDESSTAMNAAVSPDVPTAPAALVDVDEQAATRQAARTTPLRTTVRNAVIMAPLLPPRRRAPR